MNQKSLQTEGFRVVWPSPVASSSCHCVSSRLPMHPTTVRCRSPARRRRACPLSEAHLLPPGLLPSAFPGSRFAPPSTWPVVSTPAPRRESLRSARRCHPSRMFRPRGFSPPRRLAPPQARGLVASRCRPWGSPGFSAPTRHACLASSPPHRCTRPPERSLPRQPHARHRAPMPPCRSPPFLGWVTRLRGLAPPGSPSRRCTVAGPSLPRGSPGVPLLPSHGHRGGRAFRRRPDKHGANPVPAPDPCGVRVLRCGCLHLLSLPWSVVYATLPEGCASSPTNRPRGTTRVVRPTQRPAWTALAPWPEGWGFEVLQDHLIRDRPSAGAGYPRVPVVVR